MISAAPPLLARFGLACAALLCVLPFLQPYHRNPLTAFYTEWLAFALGLGVLAVLLDRRSWREAGVPWMALPAFAFAGLLIIHGFAGWSPYFGQALLAALYLVWAGLLVIAAHALRRLCGADTVLDALAAALLCGALLGAAIGVIQHFNLATPLNPYITRLYRSAVFGNLAQPNHFAAQIALGLFSLLYLHVRGRLVLPAAIAAALPLLFVLGLSGSRSAWLYLFAALALAAWLRVRGAAGGRSLLAGAGALLGVHVLLQLLAGLGWFAPASREFETAVDRLFTAHASVGDRFALWRTAAAIAADHPFLGIGWGAFPGHYFALAADPRNGALQGLFNNVHNLPLQLLAETGLLGAGLLLLPAVTGLFHVLRGMIDPGRWWLCATLAVFVLHSLLEYPLWYAYFLGIAALLLGLCPGPAFTPRLARLGPALAAAVLLAGAFNLHVLWNDYRVLERLARPGAAEARDAGFAAAILRAHGNLLLRPQVELLAAMPLRADGEDLQRRLELHARVIRFSPQPVLVYRQVLLLAMAGRLAEAQSLLAAARRVYPQAPAGFGERLLQLAESQPEHFAPLLKSLDSGR